MAMDPASSCAATESITQPETVDREDRSRAQGVRALALISTLDESFNFSKL